MTNNRFKEAMKEYFPTLQTYTPVLARVHGPSHPEVVEVRDIFAAINNKVVADGAEVDLSAEFQKLREVTSNYEVPSDGCETYAAVYQMLEETDKAYNA